MVFDAFPRFSLSMFGGRWLLLGILGTLLIATVLVFSLAILLRRLRRRRVDSAHTVHPVSAMTMPPDQATNRLPSLIRLVSPLSGKVILSDKGNPNMHSAFGCTLIPSEGKVYAPCDCTVLSIGDDLRTLMLESAENAEIFIEIGQDPTFSCKQSFIPCCKAGDKVKEGDLLLSFDMEALEKDEYDLTSAVQVTNADGFAEVKITDEKKVAVGDHLMTLVPKNMTTSPPQQT